MWSAAIAALFAVSAVGQVCPSDPILQLGADINGVTASGQFGQSVSLSGNAVAIGAPFANSGTGEVYVYFWDGTAWLPVGGVISGSSSSRFGRSVSLDGLTLAIGTQATSGPGFVRVFQWSGSAWVQLGSDIIGVNPGDQFGSSVSLDGLRLAVGSRFYDNVATDDGLVRVFEWDGATWNQLGGDLYGGASNDQFGSSVSIDGDFLAVGATQISSPGYVTVFQLIGGSWVPFGSTITGDGLSDRAGFAVSFKAGRLAIGIPQNNGAGTNAGLVRVYEQGATDWNQLGSDISGLAANDQFGISVSLDGTQLVAGSRAAGYARLFVWDGFSWVQRDGTLTGSAGDGFGWSVSVRGNYLAVGAPSLGSGMARLFNVSCMATLSPTPTPTPSCPQVCDVLNTPCTTNNDCPAAKDCSGSLCTYGACSNGCPVDTSCNAPFCTDTQLVCTNADPANCPDRFYNCNARCTSPTPTPTPRPTSIPCTEVCVSFYVDNNANCAGSVVSTPRLCSNVPFDPDIYFDNQLNIFSNVTINLPEMTISGFLRNLSFTYGTCLVVGDVYSIIINQCPTPTPTPVAFCGNNITELNEECDSVDPCCVNCMYAAENTACDDETVCNGHETCNAVGVCQPGTALDCNDSNQCTYDTCDDISGCLNTPVEDGTACDDGLFCTNPDTCVSGLCTTPARDCADSVNCTVDSCDETNDVCVHTATDSFCPSTPCRTGRCNVTSGCYTVYNPAGNCARSQGYYKNHYSEFTSFVNITYDNYICYTPATTKPKAAAIDPLYWWKQPVSGNQWIQAAYQYYAAVANYYSTVTNKCCLPALCSVSDYFADPALVECFYFVQSALKTAFPCANCTAPPACTTKPKLANSVDLTRLSSCTNMLDNFNKGQGGIVPYCNGYGLASETTSLESEEELTLDEELDIVITTFTILGSLAMVAIFVLLYISLCGKNSYLKGMLSKIESNPQAAYQSPKQGTSQRRPLVTF